MNNSTELKDIFAALSVFQGQLDNATKGEQRKGITYKYADLAACINAAKPHLAANGLAVTQLIGTYDDGKYQLTTMLTHKSGQYISTQAELPQAVLHGGSGKNPVQVIGSAITYFRRYCYSAIIGQAQEDDDGSVLNNMAPAPTTAPNELLSSSQVDQLRSMFSGHYTEKSFLIAWRLSSLNEIWLSSFDQAFNHISSLKGEG